MELNGHSHLQKAQKTIRELMKGLNHTMTSKTCNGVTCMRATPSQLPHQLGHQLAHPPQPQKTRFRQRYLFTRISTQTVPITNPSTVPFVELRGNKPCVAPPCLTSKRHCNHLYAPERHPALLQEDKNRLSRASLARCNSTANHRITKCEKQRTLLPCFTTTFQKEGREPCPFGHRGQIDGSDNHCNTALFLSLLLSFEQSNVRPLLQHYISTSMLVRTEFGI